MWTVGDCNSHTVDRPSTHFASLQPSKRIKCQCVRRRVTVAQEQRAKERLEQKRERKAARTLAIITGSFISCWLPFFILAMLRPFCAEACYTPPLLMSVINWLGYFNSLLNPIIYTIFNPDFRSAFRKILFGKYRRPRARHRMPGASATTVCQLD